MPVVLTFDIQANSGNDYPNDMTRIQVNFLRLGWEHVGGSAWRYPALGTTNVSEDWFNHVVPALMYFRSIVEHSGMVVTSYTLDAHSEAGYRANVGNPLGSPLEPGGNITTYAPGLDPAREAKLSEDRLKKFVTDAAGSL